MYLLSDKYFKTGPGIYRAVMSLLMTAFICLPYNCIFLQRDNLQNQES